MSLYETRATVRTASKEDADKILQAARDQVLHAFGQYQGLLQLYMQRSDIGQDDFDWREANSRLEASEAALARFIKG